MTGNSNSTAAAAAAPAQSVDGNHDIASDAGATGDAPAAPNSGCELRSLQAARREAVDRFEVEYIRALLRQAGGNVTRAAALAGVSRQVIHKLIAKHRPRTVVSSRA